MKVKTYGVPGLTEWHGKVRAGNIEVSVSFKGGTASPSGAQPAYFVTKDPITQFIIENSKEYKNGFIILVMQQEAPGEHPRMAVPKPSPAEQSGEAGAGARGMADDEGGQSGAAGGQSGAAALHTTRGALDDEASVETVVRVVDKYDAIEYLKEHFPDQGYTSSGLRTKAAFEAACKDCGVRFEFA